MLAKNRRENLLTHVKEARKLIEDAFDRVLVGLGLPKDRDPLAPERLTNPDKQKIRKAVDEVVARDRGAGGMSYVDARRRYLEHCAFTLVNRVAALRAMEVRGFLPKSVIAQDAQYGGVSAWARDIVEAGFVEILGESIPIRTADEARWQAIRAACVEAARGVAIVFDLQDEYSVVNPEPVAIKGLVVGLTETVTTDDWAADDILGWVYQYYNVPANVDYKERKKRARYKMTADDMIVANQFYTPHWVVRVLVDNSLGRIWWESIPDLALKRLGDGGSVERIRKEEERLRRICRETCSYLVPLPDEQRLGWWGEEARENAEARAVADARKRFDAASVKPEQGPLPAPPTVLSRPWKSVRELKIIDPACGSAHFLLYVFDVLRRMYEVELGADRPEAAEVPNLILAENLHGIDVDLRACQLGTFNLYLKARLAFREITGQDTFQPSKLRIVCAGARITEGEERAELLASFDSTPLARELAEGILKSLSKTAEIGSLLKVREQFEPLLRRQRRIRGRPTQGTFFGDTPAHQGNFLDDREIEELSLPQVLDRLKLFESDARPRGDVGRLLFAHEMAKSCGMVALLTEYYDVTLMNPPYGKMPEACKEYCKGSKQVVAHYPVTGHNFYSAFIEKAIELTLPDGLIGMITDQTFMYIKSFYRDRAEIINKLAPTELLLDCEFGVLDNATVATAVTVLRKQSVAKSNIEKIQLFFRLWQTEEGTKEAAFAQELMGFQRGTLGTSMFLARLNDFTKLPWSPFAYWVSHDIKALFEKYPAIDSGDSLKSDQVNLSEVRVGLQTGKDERFIRYFWEVPSNRIASSREETFDARGWAPLAKGGWLDKYQADVSCVVKWENGGVEIVNYKAKGGKLLSRPQNQRYYFMGAVTWMINPQMGSIQKGQMKRINARILPGGTIFTVNVCGIFPKHVDMFALLGLVNSELAYYLVRIYSNRQILVPTVASLPFPVGKDVSRLSSLAKAVYALRLSLRTSVESSPYFVSPLLLQVLTNSTDGLRPISGHPLATQFEWPDYSGKIGPCALASAAFFAALSEHRNRNDTLRTLIKKAYYRYLTVTSSADQFEKEVDREVYRLFDINDVDRALIAREIELRMKLTPSEEFDDEAEDDEDKNEDAGKTDDTLDEDGNQDRAPNSRFAISQTAQLLSFAVKSVVEDDPDGVVMITDCSGRPSLSFLVKSKFGEWFGPAQANAKWSEAGIILGKSVEDWLSQNFFDFHVNMYRRRPIFWQLTSAGCLPRGALPGAFSCLLHYHKLRANTLQDIVAHYLIGAIETAHAQLSATKSVLESLQQRGARNREISDTQRSVQIADRQYRELIEFRRRIQDLDTGARPVTPAPGPDAPWLKQKIAEVTGGPGYGRGWLPVLDYGVRVGIEPLKVAGVLPRAADRIE